MPSYEIGNLLKSLRTQKGISQEELAHPIIDRATLSRIESGKTMPHAKTLELLFERLGFDHAELIKIYLQQEDAEIKTMESELEALLVQIRRNSPKDKENNAKISDLIRRLETNEKYMDKPLNRQFVLEAKAKNAFNIKDDGNAAKFTREALHITIPQFSEADITEYHLTKTDRNLIMLTALLYEIDECYTEAANILYQLKANAEKTYLNTTIRARKTTATISNLAKILWKAHRPAELLDLCEEGIKSCHMGKEYLHYKAIAWYKAKALFMLNRKDEYVSLAKSLYYAFELYQEDYYKSYVRETVLADTGVDVAE